MSYWRTDDESVWSLSLKEWQAFFLFQGEHDNRQSKDQSLSWTSKGNTNHVPTWQTTDKHCHLMNNLHIYTAFTFYKSIHFTYTVGIPWIWIGVGCTIPFFFKPFRIAANTINRHLCCQCWSCTTIKMLIKKDKVSYSFVGGCMRSNLVETSSPWNFWLVEECRLHQQECEISSWHAHVGCLAYSGCSVVPSS